MKTIKYLIIFTLSLFVMNSCEEDGPLTSDINYVSFEGTSFGFPVDIDGTTEFPISIYATQITGSDRTFAIKVNPASTADPAAYNIPTSVTIPANTNEGILPVTISDINIGVAGKVLILEFENEEGLFTGENIQINITQNCPGNEVFLDVSFDDWGSESSWELKDSSDNIVASGGSYKDGATGYSTSFCLGVGTYTFTVNDAYGDGGTGVTVTKNNVILVDISGSDYATSISKTFEVN